MKIKKIKTQVDRRHYSSLGYDTLGRFIGYFYQKDYTLKLSKPGKTKILEIGKGNGFLENYLKREKFDVKTFDYDKTLNPDYLGDIREIDKIVRKKYDVVLCFEALEHLPYEQLENVLFKISKITKKYLVISVPQLRLYLSLWLKVTKIKEFAVSPGIFFPTEHKFNGHHYWELGCKGSSVRSFRKIISSNFNIKEEFTSAIDSYHRFFVLEKMIKNE